MPGWRVPAIEVYSWQGGRMPRIGERTRHFTESVIRRMTRVANSAGAINLSQGFPDFDPPPALMRAGAGRAGAGRTSTR